jgi:hypothetical protein
LTIFDRQLVIEKNLPREPIASPRQYAVQRRKLRGTARTILIKYTKRREGKQRIKRQVSESSLATSTTDFENLAQAME